MDHLVLLVERNHGVILYVSWPNASDYEATPEAFDTVPLHSPELGAAINAIVLPEPPAGKKRKPLTQDQRYLCKAMSLQLPPLPVHGKAECALFQRLVARQGPSIDYQAMAIAW